ncbi:MAG: hypothetical protein EHM13_00615 [Acidobacteria bacterium]|nr:MAG: hypothetical protein EHM13_00615 [Acidobacteriota bacterium]
MAKRRWGLIVLGVVIFVVVVGVALIATIGFIAYRQFDVQTVETANPDQEFDKVLARFEGQQPLIEVDPEGGTAEIHRERQRQSSTNLSNIHVLVWDPSEEKVRRFSMPFWLMRLTGGKGVSVNEGDAGDGFTFGKVKMKITAADLEKFGPGLILNFEDRGGERVIVWTE